MQLTVTIKVLSINISFVFPPYFRGGIEQIGSLRGRADERKKKKNLQSRKMSEQCL